MIDPRAKVTTDLQDFINLKEQLVDREIDRVESRLTNRIIEVKNDVNKRIDRLETGLKWFVGIAVTVGGIITSGIVALIVKFM